MADGCGDTSESGTDTPRRPYNADIHPGAAEKLYELGGSQRDVAEAFKASLETISSWESDHPEFHDACERGRSSAACQVESALYNSATGPVQSGERLTKVSGELVIVPYRRQLRPNVSAIRMLLAEGSRKYGRHNLTIARDVPDDRLGHCKTIFDLVAENEKKQENENSGDD
jgi:hypothetical protein